MAMPGGTLSAEICHMATIDLRHVRTPEEARRLMDEGLANVPRRCRWCSGLCTPAIPCHCDRAQEEARRIRAAQ